MNNRAVDLLRATKERIGTPDKWCQVLACADKHGERYPHGYPTTGPARRCAWSAFYDEGHGYTLAARMLADSALDEASGRHSYIMFNDDPTTTHKMVMKMFDKAIGLVFDGFGRGEP